MNELLFVVAVVVSQNHPDASQKITEAYIKQTKIDEALEAYQQRLISESTRRQVSRIATVARVGLERQVTFKWTFP